LFDKKNRERRIRRASRALPAFYLINFYPESRD
jgi:hypothetical protein